MILRASRHTSDIMTPRASVAPEVDPHNLIFFYGLVIWLGYVSYVRAWIILFSLTSLTFLGP